MRCITLEIKPQNLQVIWNVQFITVFVSTWMISPVYHSLRRKSIKNASSASEMGVQSVPSHLVRRLRGAQRSCTLESKFYIPFQPQKWASNKSNSSVTSSCASCGFLRSRLESQSWNSFNPFPIVNRVSAGVPTPPDSGKTPQLTTSKLAQNCGKTEVLHLQPSYGICWSHEIETLPPM